MQCSLLIRHWLREEPAGELGRFMEQAAGAQWMERRYFEAMGAAVARALGGGKK